MLIGIIFEKNIPKYVNNMELDELHFNYLVYIFLFRIFHLLLKLRNMNNPFYLIKKSELYQTFYCRSLLLSREIVHTRLSTPNPGDYLEKLSSFTTYLEHQPLPPVRTG